MRENKVYSKLDKLPSGQASEELTPGCLIVEGGAFRGIYSQGVMDVLMTHGINLQCVIGVSAGALGGLNYAAGQIGRSARINLKYRHDPEYVSFLHRRKYGGIINFDFVLRNVPNDPLDTKRFYDPERRFVAVVSNCETGEAEYKEKDNCSDILTAVQASASMPYLSDPVKLDGNEYLDGGCCVKILYQWALDQGYEKIVVIRSRNEAFRYEKEMDPRLAERFYFNRPEFAECLKTMNMRYNEDCDRLDELKREGRIFMIAPSVTWSVDRVEKDMEKLGKWYWQGCRDMKNQMKELREYLAQ